MNNLLKIFLIINLASSVNLSANNFSIPLPGTDLKMGQNVSEVVKQEEPITLYGGFGVTGIMLSHKETHQRSCTLSFPVMNKLDNEKGFLTSANCVNDNILVGDTTVGVATRPFKFDSKHGLDYAFVKIFESYWNDFRSKKIAYTDRLNKISVDFLELNIPQTSLINTPVCAYGGTSEFVCGVVLEFNVAIKSQEPGSDVSEEPTPFYNVVKVRMEKDYNKGDLGAPVYTPDLIPFSSPSKIIASPIGQVVENAEESDSANI
jgi:hypothetical protein